MGLKPADFANVDELFDQLPDILLLADRHGQIVFGNRVSREYWGLENSALAPLFMWDLLVSPQFSHQQLLELTGRLGIGDQLRLQLTAQRQSDPDGPEMDVRIRPYVREGDQYLLIIGRPESFGLGGTGVVGSAEQSIGAEPGLQSPDESTAESLDTPDPIKPAAPDDPSLQEAFSNLSDHYLRIDERGAIVAASPHLSMVLGIGSQDQLARHSLRKFISDEDWQALHRLMESGDGRFDELDVVLRTLAGESLRFSFSGSVWHHSGGWVGGIEGVLRNQSGHKDWHREYSAINARYEALFSEGNDAVLVLRSSTIVDLNQQAMEVFGSTREQLLGSTIDSLSPALQSSQRQSSELIRKYITAAEGGQSVRFDWRGRRGNGDLIDLEVSLSRVDLTGEFNLLAIVRDVTEQRADHLALERSVQIYNTIVDNSGDGITLIDLDRKVVFANRQFQTMVGFDNDRIRGCDYLQFLDEEVREAAASLFIKTFASGDDMHAQFWITTGEGERIRVAVNAVVTDYNGEPALVAFVRDITAQYEADEAQRAHRDTLADQVAKKTRSLSLARDEAEAANRAKSRFLANMSHELRTPLHSVLSFAEFGESKAAEGDRFQLKSYFNRIQASGKRLLMLVNDLLDLTQLESGGVTYKMSPCDLDALVGKVIDDMQMEIGERQVTVNRVEVEGGLRAYCDFDRVAQVLVNLLSNALKFSAENEAVVITLSNDSGHQVMVMVEDRGVGLPEDERKVLFDPFVEGVRTRSEAGGTGLGLAICKKIVDAHRGTIGGFNRPDGGATFYFTLPVEAPE